MSWMLWIKFLSIFRSNPLLDQQWLMTHRYFITMGGFHLFEHSSEERRVAQSISQEDNHPLHPLLTNDLIRDGIYLFAMLTEVKIKDREKSDWLTKSLVLLQTLWFVMQCIPWAIEHLLVMHLEIITLAYAAMNFVIYIFWWNKPLNINQLVQVLQILDPSATVGIDPQGLGVSGPSETLPQVNESFSEAQKFTWKVIVGGLLMIYKFIASVQDNDVNLSHEDRVLRIWANNTYDDATNGVLILLGVGVCFGAIHCTTWLFSFPTHIELLIWQILSVCITAVPIYILLVVRLSRSVGIPSIGA